MTDDRIKAAQEEIEKDLPARPEYVVNTSEFNDVKARIAMLHGKRNLDTDPTGPTLRRPRGNDTDPVDANNDAGKPKPDQDGRPTLKRRDGENN